MPLTGSSTVILDPTAHMHVRPDKSLEFGLNMVPYSHRALQGLSAVSLLGLRTRNALAPTPVCEEPLAFLACSSLSGLCAIIPQAFPSQQQSGWLPIFPLAHMYTLCKIPLPVCRLSPVTCWMRERSEDVAHKSGWKRPTPPSLWLLFPFTHLVLSDAVL